MGYRFTRRRFLAVVGAGVTYAALTGCDLRESASKARTPKGGSVGTPRVWPAQNGSSAASGRAWVFRSRPDLRPPAVEVSTGKRGRAAGYVFIAPKLGEGEHGPMIFDDAGTPVWFREGLYALNFRVQKYQGEPVLTWWEGKATPRPSVGEYVILDGSYREVKRVQAGNGYGGNQHDFLITPQSTALLTIYNLVSQDLSYLGGPVEGRVIDGVVQEVDIETGEVLFEWHSLDHVGLEESYYRPSPDLDWGFDYFHINSVDPNPEGYLTISARRTSAVYKVDRNTGEVEWRLGGKYSDFEMGPGTRMYWQHDVRRHSDNIITIFDNARVTSGERSRGIVVEIDEDAMEATLVGEYVRPEKTLSDTQGNVQVLPGGHVFVGWGSEPYFSEFSRDGELLFDASFPPEVESYRAFRFPWKGEPQTRPAIVAESGEGDEVEIYVSWNGATEVAAWRVLAGPRPDELKPVGSFPRAGFETIATVQEEGPFFAVEAEDDAGQKLATSLTVKPQDRTSVPPNTKRG